ASSRRHWPWWMWLVVFMTNALKCSGVWLRDIEVSLSVTGAPRCRRIRAGPDCPAPCDGPYLPTAVLRWAESSPGAPHYGRGLPSGQPGLATGSRDSVDEHMNTPAGCTISPTRSRHKPADDAADVVECSNMTVRDADIANVLTRAALLCFALVAALHVTGPASAK